MIIGKAFRVSGEPIRDNEQYRLYDNTFLKNLTVSMTVLKKRQSTNGHKHDGKEEVYIFTSGQGAIQIGDKLTSVEHGDIVSIPAGEFHKVIAVGSCDLEFISIFEAYTREPVDKPQDPLG